MGYRFAYTVTVCYNIGMDEKDLAYIAGFFDGEGNATIRMVKGSNGKRYPRLEARLTQNDRVVLDWIQSHYGGGVYEKKDPRTVNIGHALCLSYRKARVFLT